MKWILTTIFSIIIWIHISPWPHLTRITPTRLCTTWTDHICRIGIIRLNMTYILNLMTIIFKIISILHRVHGDSPTPRLIFKHFIRKIHFPTYILILFFLFHKLKKNLIWKRATTNSKLSQFTILPTSNFIYSFSCSTNRSKIQFGMAYGSHAWVPTTSSKFAQLTILSKSNSI